MPRKVCQQRINALSPIAEALGRSDMPPLQEARTMPGTGASMARAAGAGGWSALRGETQKKRARREAPQTSHGEGARAFLEHSMEAIGFRCTRREGKETRALACEACS
jgi:hypothetical protein